MSTVIPENLFDFDPKDPSADLLVVDISSANGSDLSFGLRNTPIVRNTHIEDQAQSTLGMSALGSLTKEPLPRTSVTFASVWHCATTDANFSQRPTDDIFSYIQKRVMELYSKHFPHNQYDPDLMAGLLDQLLDNDQLGEGEELGLLALELTQHLVGTNDARYWKSKGELARVYYAQGRYNEAYNHFAEVAQFFKSTCGSHDRNTLLYQLNLAVTLFDQGKRVEAKSRCRDVVDKARDIFSQQDDFTLTAEFHLARVHSALNERREAGDILNAIFTARGDHQSDTFCKKKHLAAAIELAKSFSALGQKTEAISIFLNVERELQRSIPVRTMWTLELVRSVGNLLFNLQDYLGAERVFSDLFTGTLARVQSRRHPKAVHARLSIGYALSHQGRYEESNHIFAECLDILKSTLGPYHRLTLQCMSGLAWSHCIGYIPTDLCAKLQEVRDLSAQHLGELDREALYYESDYITVLRGRGDWEAARVLLKRLVSKCKALKEADRQFVALQEAEFQGAFYAAMGMYDKATTQQKKALTRAESFFGKDHPKTMQYLYLLARSLTRTNSYSEAEDLLLDGKFRLSGSVGARHPATTLLNGELAQLYSDQRRWSDVETIQRDILRSYELYEPSHPYVVYAIYEIAYTFTKQRKFLEAEGEYQHLLRILTSRSEAVATRISIMIGLAYCYYNMQAFQRAEQQIQATTVYAYETGNHDHPKLHCSQTLIALVYRDTNRRVKAEDLARKLLPRFENNEKLYCKWCKWHLEDLVGKPKTTQDNSSLPKPAMTPSDLRIIELTDEISDG